jgi:hypothetical protein
MADIDKIVDSSIVAAQLKEITSYILLHTLGHKGINGDSTFQYSF